MAPISEGISEILKDTYGKNPMTRELTVVLTQKIADWDSEDDGYYLNREDMIRQTVWDWFSGGETAAHVARQIEGTL